MRNYNTTSKKLTKMLKLGNISIIKGIELRQHYEAPVIRSYESKGWECYKYKISPAYEEMAPFLTIVQWHKEAKDFINSIWEWINDIPE